MTQHIGTWELVRVVLTADRLSSTITDVRPAVPAGEVRDTPATLGFIRSMGRRW